MLDASQTPSLKGCKVVHEMYSHECIFFWEDRVNLIDLIDVVT